MIFYYFLLGVFSLLSQIVLLRELVTWLGGDEIFYALGLGFWLLLAGLGSLLIKQFKRSLHWAFLAIYPLLTPIILVLLRFVLGRILPVGQIPSLSGSVLIAFLTLLIPAFSSGVIFGLGIQKWPESSRAYLWETIGFFIAGLVFTFFLSQTAFPLPSRLNRRILHWRYPNLTEIVYSKGSQLIVTKQDKQKSIFSAGELIFNSQKDDFHSLTGRILSHLQLPLGQALIFNSLHLANELSRWNAYGPVIYLQPEKKIALQQKPYFNYGVILEVNQLNQYLEKSPRWNWIILSPGTPKTLAANRYFTLEMFNLVKSSLTADGTCVLVFNLPVDYQSEEALRFGQVIYHTFDQVFENVDLLIIEGKIVLIGSEKEIKYDMRDSSGFLEMVLSDSRREQLKEKLSGGSQVNTNRHPLAYFNHHLFWQTMFSFQLPKLIQHLVWLIPISLVLILLDLVKQLKRGEMGILIGVSGFILMSLETVLLFMFQTQFGNLYSYLGLIMGTILLGMAVGVKIIEIKKLKYKSEPKSLLFFYLPLGAFLLLDFWQKTILIWLVLGLLIGLVGGLLFALTNQLWLKKSENQTFIYACDLFGSFLGAVLTATILLPKFGLPVFLLLLMTLTVVPRFKP